MMREDGKEVTESILKTQLCGPMVVKAAWHKAMLKQFGEVCRSSAAMARVISSLETRAGLMKVASCMTSNIPLHGVSEENIGIAECRVLFKEFQKVKTSGQPETTAEVDKQQPQQDQDTHDMVVELETLGADETMATSDKKAREDMLRQMDRLHRCAGPDALASLKKTVKSYVNVSTRTCFLLDAPTSRPKVATDFIDGIKDIVTANSLTSFSIAVPCAGRIDFMSVIQDKLAQTFPESQVFVTILTSGNSMQSQKKKTKFALLVHQCPPKHVPSVPTSIASMKGKARAWECLRMRCLSLSCPLRSEADKKAAQEALEKEKAKSEELRNMIALQRMELNRDDCAEPDDDHEAMSEEEDAGESVQVQCVQPDEGKRDFIIELFPFTRSMSFYKPLLEQALCVSAASGLTVILTTTAHPSSGVAAVLLGQECFVAMPSVNSHADLHGKKIAEDMLFNNARQSMAGSAGSLKRPLNNSLQLIDGGRVPEDCPWDLAELQPDSADTFAGVNILSGSLDVRVPLLLQKELNDNRLSLDFNDQLSLIVRTHNGSGVAKNSPLCLNYGLHFDLEAAKAQQAVETDDRVKRFRGALDAVLAKGSQASQGQTSNASEAVAVPAKTAATLAALPAPSPKPPTPTPATPPTATPAPAPPAPSQAAPAAPPPSQVTPQKMPDGENMPVTETVLATGVSTHNLTFSEMSFYPTVPEAMVKQERKRARQCC
ncbi:unnamed protein product [Symbiodinium necroappetens]|uniref:Uncharacterized protein n=1 Tax=Symbiodinium necroappetens TaxID=1628268 RepID=A0A812QI30_9DINO|nr:unnamed protein product [Symbiodinium necroappetens]